MEKDEKLETHFFLRVLRRRQAVEICPEQCELRSCVNILYTSQPGWVIDRVKR